MRGKCVALFIFSRGIYEYDTINIIITVIRHQTSSSELGISSAVWSNSWQKTTQQGSYYAYSSINSSSGAFFFLFF